MKVGRPPAAFFKFFPATAGAGFVAPHLGLHGFSDRALVDSDPEWHPVSMNGHDGIGQLIGELAAHPGLGHQLVRTSHPAPYPIVRTSLASGVSIWVSFVPTHSPGDKAVGPHLVVDVSRPGGSPFPNRDRLARVRV